MQVGDSLTCTPKQLIYLKQRFRKYGYKMNYQETISTDQDFFGPPDKILCTRDE